MTSRRRYKEVRLQQLRSFCETARLGSLAAAAKSLGLTQPTVWEQVHALERDFGVKLVEPFGRGCRLTDGGRLLVEMSAALVISIDSLKRRFQEARGEIDTRLTIAASERILVEDLPHSIVRFRESFSNVHICFLAFGSDSNQVLAAVDSGQADVGVTTEWTSVPANPRLLFEPAYELDLLLVTPKDHPLARRRRVVPGDLLGYPLVNPPQSVIGADSATTSALDKLGFFRTQPRQIEAVCTPVIRRYVEMGFGIGLVLGLPSQASTDELHVRSLSRHFPRTRVNLVWRKEAIRDEMIRGLLATIRALLDRPLRSEKKPGRHN